MLFKSLIKDIEIEKEILSSNFKQENVMCGATLFCFEFNKNLNVIYISLKKSLQLLS